MGVRSSRSTLSFHRIRPAILFLPLMLGACGGGSEADKAAMLEAEGRFVKAVECSALAHVISPFYDSIAALADRADEKAAAEAREAGFQRAANGFLGLAMEESRKAYPDPLKRPLTGEIISMERERLQSERNYADNQADLRKHLDLFASCEPLLPVADRPPPEAASAGKSR